MRRACGHYRIAGPTQYNETVMNACRAAALSLLASVYAAAWSGLAFPQPAPRYPSKLIRIIVPFAPAGGTDILARALGQRIETQRWAKVIRDGNIHAE
jgi:tripartite-type tricarboxylate transporter receptor subunit TctC